MPATFTASDLAHFCGSGSLYHMPMFAGWRYTEGVKFLTRNDCCWLVTDILSVLKFHPKVKLEEFVCIKLVVSADKDAVVTYDDGNGVVFYRQKYENTDCPVSEIKFYATDGVLLLAGER